MLLFTNEKEDAYFLDAFKKSANDSKKLYIATGYFGVSLIKEIEDTLECLAEKSICKVLIGMIYREGITKKQKTTLEGLDKRLRDKNPDSGVYISVDYFHGKIYRFEQDLYIGSSNLSMSGFKSRRECTVKITDEIIKKETDEYLKILFSENNAWKLGQVDLPVNLPETRFFNGSSDLSEYRHEGAPKLDPILCEMKISLRVDEQPKSSLNLYFSKGRKNNNNNNGVYTPRPWYEIEIGTTVDEQRNRCYPSEDFTGYCVNNDSYYKLDMKVCSGKDKNKALAGRTQRKLLGMYIKGKLESRGLLKEGERITSEILEEYGKDYITLKKVGEKAYIIEF
jgi:hypothetical protein